MINYKLAKQLKEAGFPQTEGICYVGEKQVEYAKWGFEKGTIICRILILSELIEACGDDFAVLKKYISGGWCASNHYEDDDEEEGANWIRYDGKTPEVAVAKLWLKLNENKRI